MILVISISPNVVLGVGFRVLYVYYGPTAIQVTSTFIHTFSWIPLNLLVRDYNFNVFLLIICGISWEQGQIRVEDS